jgi:2-polyprenyl-6-methoxyphenol hydroxylase-like FAD-dependent oxidoreductase
VSVARTNRYRALVIGAGPAGLAAALAVRGAGVESVVLEQVRRFGAAGTGLTLWPNALAALAVLGAVGPIRTASQPTEGNEIRSSSGELLDVVPGWEMRERFRGTGVGLLRSELLDGLLDQLGRDTVRTGTRCVDYRAEADRVVVKLADGTEESGDLLIGADGIRSMVRGRLLAGADRLRYAGFPVWRGVTEFPLGPAPGLLTMGPGAQFGLFPMRADRVYWFAAMSLPEGRAETIPARPLLIERFGRWHAPIPAVIKATTEERIVVTDIYDRRPLRRWGRGRVTLVGDAAHPSTPNLGQGTCQAFEDAAVLGHELGRHDDIGSALRAYEARRRKRANGMTSQARRLGRLGQWHNPVACWLREQMLKQVPHEPRMRQLSRMFAFDLD